MYVYCIYCSKSGEYDKSVEVYETLTNLENFEDLCQKGLACYKAGKLEESFKGMQTYWVQQWEGQMVIALVKNIDFNHSNFAESSQILP